MTYGGGSIMISGPGPFATIIDKVNCQIKHVIRQGSVSENGLCRISEYVEPELGGN